MHLALREPTPAMQAQFADYVESVLQDAKTANELRRELMGEVTKMLMRELMVETLNMAGWEVTWEYVDVGNGDGEDEEDILFRREEDVGEERSMSGECGVEV
jgi:hypothetical protein